MCIYVLIHLCSYNVSRLPPSSLSHLPYRVLFSLVRKEQVPAILHNNNNNRHNKNKNNPSLKKKKKGLRVETDKVSAPGALARVRTEVRETERFEGKKLRERGEFRSMKVVHRKKEKKQEKRKRINRTH